MTLVILLVGVLIGLCLVMAAAWRMQERTGHNGWADVFWTYGLGLAGAVFALVPIGRVGWPTARQELVAVFIIAWSLRLGTHILQRTMKGGDDPRYAQLRRDWGEQASARMFKFLQVQALFAWMPALSVLAAAHNPRPWLDWRDYLGLAIIVVAILGEGIADRQLKAFAKDPANKGRVCDVGLWRWSRHPNYFFEWFGWLAYLVIALGPLDIYPWGLAGFIAPIVMYVLLVLLSGIPPLEEHMLRSRPEAFRAYQARTNAFFPLPPKRG